MTVIMAFIPILLILLFSWFIRVGMKNLSKRIVLTKRLAKGIILSYVSVLLFAVILYELMPANEEEIFTKSDLEKLENENQVFDEAFRKNEVSKLHKDFLVEEWTHEIEGDTFHIVSSNPDYLPAKVFVEWTDSKEKRIEGKMYRTNLFINGMNMKDRIPFSKVKWEGDQLIIEMPTEQEFKYYRFSNNLAILTNNDVFPSNETVIVHGETYLYLTVPKHMNVVDEMGLQLY
ncbi:hypothetical protein [Psychrobacillus sp. FJAT-21963]|uniref:hypothetical protein n=1 Tax=Psychrobacillus sp. FJAT-21963 TaxID=1712028 RepID=UPI0006F65FFF|nr:hypothetical protein [Psychrobacillus sp. FJAT-21963]KQL35211.1 hypothetical protein AN959_09715 [Psychrobacillus sp. FJAT-21963]